MPVTYADWWGDWHRSFRVPEELRNLPEQLPDEYRRPLVLQSLAGGELAHNSKTVACDPRNVLPLL